MRESLQAALKSLQELGIVKNNEDKYIGKLLGEKKSIRLHWLALVPPKLALVPPELTLAAPELALVPPELALVALFSSSIER